MNPFAVYRWRDIFLLLGIAVIYLLVAQTTHHYFASIGMALPIVRPQTGFALGVLLLAGKKYWPAVFIGSFVSKLMLGFTLFNSLLATLGLLAGIVSGTWVLLNDKKFDLSIASLNDFFRLIFFAGLTSACVSSLTGAFALLDSPAVNQQIFGNPTLIWWMADTLGIILISPLLLTWSQLPRHWFQKRYLFEILLFFTSSFLAGQIIFLNWYHDLFGLIARGYWMFLFVVWGAARLGFQSVTLVIFITSIQALIGAAAGKGFFATDIEQTQLSNFWFYMLALSIVGMGLAATVNAFKKVEAEIRIQAHHDTLTGLANRLLLTDRLVQEIATAKRNNQHLAIIFHDLDKFKPVNDNYGHQMGDLLLKEVAKRLKDCIREMDTVARIGGDEFVILLPMIEDSQDVIAVAERIHTSLLLPFEIQGETINISTSIGIALYPEHGLDDTTLLVNADNAMYFAKNSGRNNIQIYSPTIMANFDRRN